jgi:hypothetical protein
MNVTGQPVAGRPGVARWAGLGGVVYVVLFVVGTILSFSGAPDTDSAPAKIVAYYSKGSHRDKINWGWALVVLGVFFFLWFLAALRQLLRRVDADGFLTGLATIGGAVYATTTLAGMSVNAAIKTMSDDTYHHQVFPELIHAADDAGYVLHSSGGVGIGALMIAATLAAFRGGLIPNWLCWVGTVSGILAIGSIFFFPQFLVALWILIGGVLVFRASGPVHRAGGPAAGMAA